MNPIHPISLGGYLRLPTVLQYIPVSKSTWWAGVQSGRYPAGVKLSARCTGWRISDIQNLLDQGVLQ